MRILQNILIQTLAVAIMPFALVGTLFQKKHI